jgi:hypothetical protein
MPEDQKTVDDELNDILDDDDDDSDVLSQPDPEPEPEPEPKKAAPKEEGPLPVVDCRKCAHYPFRSQKVTTKLSEELRSVTKNFKRAFCGTAPAEGINCRGKEYTPAE